MSLAENPPPPLGPDWKPWGERLASFLARTKSKLAYYIAGESASEDGVILWDRTGYPVISKNGVYRQIVLADGYGNFSATSDIVASQADTAYAIAFTTAVANGGISLNASDSTRIDFVEAGVYSISGYSLNLPAPQLKHCIGGLRSTALTLITVSVKTWTPTTGIIF